MREKCLERLKELFGCLEFEYVVVKETEDGCVFITISEESYKRNERSIEVYYVDNLEVYCESQYIIDLENNASILKVIADISKIYGK